jgi:hypothetical protein
MPTVGRLWRGTNKKGVTMSEVSDEDDDGFIILTVKVHRDDIIDAMMKKCPKNMFEDTYRKQIEKN